jgi:hypothetical protein
MNTTFIAALYCKVPARFTGFGGSATTFRGWIVLPAITVYYCHPLALCALGRNGFALYFLRCL